MDNNEINPQAEVDHDHLGGNPIGGGTLIPVAPASDFPYLMVIEAIINYIMDTPENINVNILREFLLDLYMKNTNNYFLEYIQKNMESLDIGESL